MGGKDLTRKILVSSGKKSIWLTSNFKENSGDKPPETAEEDWCVIRVLFLPPAPSCTASLTQNTENHNSEHRTQIKRGVSLCL